MDQKSTLGYAWPFFLRGHGYGEHYHRRSITGRQCIGLRIELHCVQGGRAVA